MNRLTKISNYPAVFRLIFFMYLYKHIETSVEKFLYLIIIFTIVILILIKIKCKIGDSNFLGRHVCFGTPRNPRNFPDSPKNKEIQTERTFQTPKLLPI